MQYLKQVGQLTVIQKPNKRNTIPEDFGIEPEYEGIPYDLVIDGKIMEDNLKEIGKDYNWLKKEVRKIWHESWASFNCNDWWKESDVLPKERKIRTIIAILRRCNSINSPSTCRSTPQRYLSHTPSNITILVRI